MVRMDAISVKKKLKTQLDKPINFLIDERNFHNQLKRNECKK